MYLTPAGYGSTQTINLLYCVLGVINKYLRVRPLACCLPSGCVIGWGWCPQMSHCCLGCWGTLRLTGAEIDCWWGTWSTGDAFSPRCSYWEYYRHSVCGNSAHSLKREKTHVLIAHVFIAPKTLNNISVARSSYLWFVFNQTSPSFRIPSKSDVNMGRHNLVGLWICFFVW